MEADGQLAQQRLLPPAVAVLQHDQPPVRRQRDRRPSVPLPRAAPSLRLAIPPRLERRTQRLVPPQPHPIRARSSGSSRRRSSNPSSHRLSARPPRSLSIPTSPAPKATGAASKRSYFPQTAATSRRPHLSGGSS